MNDQWTSVSRRDRSVNRVLLTAVAVVLIIAVAVGWCFGGERDAVLFVDGCTAFVVEDDLLVTAKHCRHPSLINVTLEDRTAVARRLYLYEGEDGPAVFHLSGGPYESLPVASAKPEPGARVSALGYPGGNWARIEGEMVGGNGIDVNYVRLRLNPGNSGGPLLNEHGEVVGVALHVASDLGVNESGFSGWQVTTEAIRTAMQLRSAPGRPQVVVFSTDGCPPCRALERDVRAGHFDEFEFVFVRWNERVGEWSRPELYREFWQTCNPDRASLGFPTIWVRGTDRYRVGYSAERRGGLLGWLADAVRHLLDGLVGRQSRPEFPGPPGLVPIPDAETPEPTPAPPAGVNETEQLIGNLLEEISALREQATKTKSDLEEFKESGVVGKIRALARLKSDKDEALARVEAVRTDVETLRSRFRENPLQFLWGLIGMITGLIHRRFAN